MLQESASAALRDLEGQDRQLGGSRGSNVGSSGASHSTDGGGLRWFWQSVESPGWAPSPTAVTGSPGSTTSSPGQDSRRRRWGRASTAGPQTGQGEAALGTPRARDRRGAPPDAPQQEPPVRERTSFVVPRSSPSRLAEGFIVNCTVCGQALGAAELRGHEVRHHGDHAFRCTCTKRFASSQDLRRHSRARGHAIPAAYRLPGEEPFEIVVPPSPER